MQHAKRNSHGRGHPNSRSPANDHLANGFGHFAVVLVGVKNLFRGQAPLVQHDHAAVGPFDGLRYVHSLSSLTTFQSLAVTDAEASA